MPTLTCPCGFVQDLTPSSGAGWVTIPDAEYYPLLDAEVKSVVTPNDPALEEEADALFSQVVGSLYECPTCQRLLWIRGGEEVCRVFTPESTQPVQESPLLD